MNRKSIIMAITLVIALSVIIVGMVILHNKRADMRNDEIGFAALSRYAQYKNLSIDDFEQPTIWAQLSKEARQDPRGSCITVCYKTKASINPRHILLLYISPSTGIIDEECLVEDICEGR